MNPRKATNGSQMHPPAQSSILPLSSVPSANPRALHARLPIPVAETSDGILVPVSDHFNTEELHQILKMTVGTGASTASLPLPALPRDSTNPSSISRPISTTQTSMIPSAARGAGTSPATPSSQSKIQSHPLVSNLSKLPSVHYDPHDFAALQREIDQHVESGEIDRNLSAAEKSKRFIEICHKKFQQNPVTQTNGPADMQLNCPHIDAYLAHEARMRAKVKKQEEEEKRQNHIRQLKQKLSQLKEQQRQSIERANQIELKSDVAAKIKQLTDENHRSQLPITDVSRELLSEEVRQLEELQLEVIKLRQEVADSCTPNQEMFNQALKLNAVQKLLEFQYHPTIRYSTRIIFTMMDAIVMTVDEYLVQEVRFQIDDATHFNCAELKQMPLVQEIEQTEEQYTKINQQMISAQSEIDSVEWKQQEEVYSPRQSKEILQMLKYTLEKLESAEDCFFHLEETMQEQQIPQAEQEAKDVRKAADEEKQSSIAVQMKNVRKRKSDQQQHATANVRSTKEDGTENSQPLPFMSSSQPIPNSKRSHKRKQPASAASSSHRTSSARSHKYTKLEPDLKKASRTASSTLDSDPIEDDDDDFMLDLICEEDNDDESRPQRASRVPIAKPAKSKPGYSLPISVVCNTISKAKQDFIRKQRQRSNINEESIEDEDIDVVIEECDMVQMD